jgi:hypothetical protein
LLAFYLLKMIDRGISTGGLIIILSGIAISIAFLIFFLFRYLRIPPSGDHN